MPIIIKTLGYGLSISATANLYNVPAGRSAAVGSVRMVNAGTGDTGLMNLYVRASGGSTVARRIYKKDFKILVNKSLIITDDVILGEGDAIQLEAPAGTTQNIHYTVNGIERE